MRSRNTLALLPLLLAGCTAAKFDLSGAPCTDAGECVADYTCYDDGSTLTCVTAGDGCATAGEQSPCTFGETTCDNGCRTCTDDGGGNLQWSACEVPVMGDECVPGSATCDMSGSLVVCTANGFIDSVTPCGPPGCNDTVATPRCNDCIPGVNFCDTLEFVTCTLEGLEGSRTDCATANQCAGAGACNAGSGCSILMTAPDGTACDEGTAMDGDFCNSSCVSGVCTALTPAVCDDMDPCTDDSCSTTMGCQFSNSTAGSPCPGTDTDWCTSSCDGFGTCDDMTPVDCDDMEGCTNDVCNGGLCSNNAANPGMTCRPVAGPCDVEEQCDGMNPSCPADGFVSAMSMTSCRAPGMMEPCDVEEFCDGTQAACPMDAVEPGMNTVSCRGVAGPCDVEDFCDGTSKTCPTDAVELSTASCRASMGPCDIEDFCDGSTVNCPDILQPGANTFSCRAPGVGEVCDIEEFCDGMNPGCPAVDAVEAGGMTVECRASSSGDVCDPAEYCDGSLKTCPADVTLSNGDPCGAQMCAGSVLTQATCLSASCSGSTMMDCDDMLACNSTETCNVGMGGCVPGSGGACDDSCACSADICTDPASCTANDMTGCNSLQMSGPMTASPGATADVTLDIGCVGEAADITCTATGRYCISGPATFEGSLSGWHDGGGSNAIDNADCDDNTNRIATTNCQVDAGTGDLMRMPRDSFAEMSATVDATGYTDLRLNLRAALSCRTDAGEEVEIRACCGVAAASAGNENCASDANNEIGEIYSVNDGGWDAWGDRPCTGPTNLDCGDRDSPQGSCSGAGYLLPTGNYGGSSCGGTTCQFDDCPSVLVGFDWNTNNNDEMAYIDDIIISGVQARTPTITDNMDGTYTVSVSTCTTGSIVIDCQWNPQSTGNRTNVPSPGPTDSFTVDFQ